MPVRAHEPARLIMTRNEFCMESRAGFRNNIADILGGAPCTSLESGGFPGHVFDTFLRHMVSNDMCSPR